MIETVAQVRQLVGDDAEVETSPDGGCGRCHETGGCGGSQVMGRIFTDKPRVFLAVNVLHAQPGDRVVVEVEDGMVWRGALQAYLVPLCLILAGAMLGRFVAGDTGAIAGSAAALSGTMAWLWVRRGSGMTRPRIVRHASGCS